MDTESGVWLKDQRVRLCHQCTRDRTRTWKKRTNREKISAKTLKKEPAILKTKKYDAKGSSDIGGDMTYG